MSDNETPNGSATGTDISDDGQNAGVSPEDTTNPDESTSQTVSRSVAEQYRRDMLRYKAEKRELEARIAETEKSKLKEANDWKSYAEKMEAERNDLDAKLKGWAQSTINDKRLSAVREEARKLNIRAEAEEDMNLLSMDDVQVEQTDTGRILVHGAEDFAKRLHKMKPHWFSPTKAPIINGGGGSAPPAPKTLNASDVYQAELQHKAGKITKEAYLDVVAKYDKQKP